MKHLGDEYERTEKGWIQRPAKDYVHKTFALMGVENCNPSNVLGSNAKLTPSEQEEENVDLTPEGATTYRQLVGKCTFCCRNRVDMQYALKKLQADMAKPTKGSERRLTKFLR